MKKVLYVLMTIAMLAFSIWITLVFFRRAKDTAKCDQEFPTQFTVVRDLFNVSQAYRQFTVYTGTDLTAKSVNRIKQSFPKNVTAVLTGKQFTLKDTSDTILMKLDCSDVAGCLTGFPEYDLYKGTDEKNVVGTLDKPMRANMPAEHMITRCVTYGAFGAALLAIIMIIVRPSIPALQAVIPDGRQKALQCTLIAFIAFIAGGLIGLCISFAFRNEVYTLSIPQQEKTETYSAAMPYSHLSGFEEFTLKKNNVRFGVIKRKSSFVTTLEEGCTNLSECSNVFKQQYTLCLPKNATLTEQHYGMLIVAAVDQSFKDPPHCSGKSPCGTGCSLSKTTNKCKLDSSSGGNPLLIAAILSWFITIVAAFSPLWYKQIERSDAGHAGEASGKLPSRQIQELKQAAQGVYQLNEAAPQAKLYAAEKAVYRKYNLCRLLPQKEDGGAQG